MTKLLFPKNGIHPVCQTDIQECARELLGAVANCSFTIPAGFAYESYLRNLSSELNGYKTEVKSIGAKLKLTDKNFDRLSDNLTASANKITTIKINKRDRMIV